VKDNLKEIKNDNKDSLLEIKQDTSLQFANQELKPIRKFNNGRGALLCNKCRTIMATGKEAWEGNATLCEDCKYVIISDAGDEQEGMHITIKELKQ